MKDLYENGKLGEVIDPMMVKDITSGKKNAVGSLCFTCSEMLRGER